MTQYDTMQVVILSVKVIAITVWLAGVPISLTVLCAGLYSGEIWNYRRLTQVLIIAWTLSGVIAIGVWFFGLPVGGPAR